MLTKDQKLFILEMGERVATQDNRITEHPIFYVQKQVRVPAMEGQGDGFALYLNGEEVDDEYLESEGLDRDDCDEFWYTLEYEDVQPFLTEASAQAHIDANHYHYTNPRVYVKSAWRNMGWQAIRDLLMDSEFINWLKIGVNEPKTRNITWEGRQPIVIDGRMLRGAPHITITNHETGKTRRLPFYAREDEPEYTQWLIDHMQVAIDAYKDTLGERSNED